MECRRHRIGPGADEIPRRRRTRLVGDDQTDLDGRVRCTQARLRPDRSPRSFGSMTRWTNFVLAHRGRILLVWLVVFVLGGLGSANLGGLLSNRFSVPGSESEKGRDLLKDRMNDRSDGAFTLVATGVDSPPERRSALVAAARRGAAAVEGGKAGPLLDAAPRVAYVQISTPLENQ